MLPLVLETYFEMDDGVRLYTRLVSPAPLLPRPIVFIRTPYEPARHGDPCQPSEYEQDLFIRHGYAVLLQHCRGTGDSEGVFTPYSRRERDDGLKTLELMRELPVYNHEIYPFGGSYLAQVHYLYLDTKPEDVRGAVLCIQTDDMYFRNFRNGSCYAFSNYGWWAQVLRRQYPNITTENVLRRPYSDIPLRMTGENVPILKDMLMHDENDDFWASIPMTNALSSLDIPVLLVEGWFDYYAQGMFAGWEKLPEETRKKSAMLVLPCGHATSLDGKSDYPLPHGNPPADYAVAWFDSLRENKPYPYVSKGQIGYYHLGTDEWKTSPFPAETGKLRLYPAEGGQLSPVPSAGEISYSYDPQRLHHFFRYGNMFRHPAADASLGIVSFYSTPFEEDTEFFGRIRWHARVRSDCEDTCFFMRVYLVENGESYNLTETLSTLRHIKKDYHPGETLTLDLLTTPISFTVKRGCALRVDVSSDSTIYSPHANVAGHWALVTETKIARNTLLLGEEGYIELPVR